MKNAPAPDDVAAAAGDPHIRDVTRVTVPRVQRASMTWGIQGGSKTPAGDRFADGRPQGVEW
jgi:hypothetical protein